MDIFRGVINEIKKNRRTGLLTLTITSLLIVITFQGMVGLTANSVDENNIYVTALGIYFRLFYPVIVGILISLTLYNEKRKEGILIYYYNAFPITKVFRNKICAYQIQALIVYVICILFAMLFIILEGGNPLRYVINNLNGIVFSMIGIMVLVNIQFLISLILKNQILSLSIAILGSIGNLFIASTTLWPYFPWSYLYRMLYHTSVEMNQVVTMGIIFVVSFVALFLSTKRFKEIMLTP